MEIVTKPFAVDVMSTRIGELLSPRAARPGGK
jgi:hypothetical protein